MKSPKSHYMETVSSFNSAFRDDNRDMEQLLEAFGGSFSLETISSAYSQANRNVDWAGVILYELQGSTAVPRESKVGMDAASISPLELSTEDTSKNPNVAEGNSAGLGNNFVSGISEGEKLLMSTNGSSRTQPSDVPSNEPLTTSFVNTEKDHSLHADFEDFLFKMLGDGFQLGMEMIHEVLSLCGYDLEKSMETLVDLSASTLEKSDDVVSTDAEKEMDVYMKNGSISEKSQSGSSQRLVKQNGKESRKQSNNNYALQREILGALFSAPERVEKLPIKTSTRSRGSRSYGRMAEEPVKETNIEQTFVAVKPLAGHDEIEDKEDENSYLNLRKAVKENWAIMKEYYKAATDAYNKGDQLRAYKLMEEGHFYNKKAREADEMSGQKLLEAREDEVSLDISSFELKEAIKLLKLHLSNYAGIPSIRYLKVSVGDDGGENKKRSLKRLVLKLLERESISCTEEDNGKTLVIQIEEINPKNLSFTKK